MTSDDQFFFDYVSIMEGDKEIPSVLIRPHPARGYTP